MFPMEETNRRFYFLSDGLAQEPPGIVAVTIGGISVTEEKKRRENRERMILRRVERIIAHQNIQFILEHQNDSLQQLSAYLQACMEQLGHVPARVEVTGGDYIEYRFGSWQNAIRSFYSGKMAAAKNPPAFENRRIVRELCAAEEQRLSALEASDAERTQV